MRTGPARISSLPCVRFSRALSRRGRVAGGRGRPGDADGFRPRRRVPSLQPTAAWAGRRNALHFAVGKFASPSPDVAVAVNRGVFERGGVQLLLNRRGSFAFGPLVLGGESPYSIDLGDVDGDGDLARRSRTPSRMTSPCSSTASAAWPRHPDRPPPTSREGLPSRTSTATAGRTSLPRAGIIRTAPGLCSSSTDRLPTTDLPVVPGAAGLPGRRLRRTGGAGRRRPQRGRAHRHRRSGSDRGQMVVSYRRRGNRGFAPVTILSPVAGGPIDVAAGDLNRDGRTDLAMATLFRPKVAVLLRRRNRPGFRHPGTST